MHLNFSFFSSLSFRLSNEIHLSYTVAGQGYRILGVFAVDHGLYHTRVSFCFGGGLGFFLCVWFFLVWVCFGGFFVGMGLFIWAFCLFGLRGWSFGGLFVFFYFTATLSAFLLFRDELITSHWWGVVHYDLHFFTMIYKSSLAEFQRSPVPSEILLLVLK